MLAFSIRNFMISNTIFLLSLALSLLPRIAYALNIFSRKSRRSLYCIKGTQLGFCKPNNHLPSIPASFAASAAAVRTASGKPAKSASLSIIN